MGVIKQWLLPHLFDLVNDNETKHDTGEEEKPDLQPNLQPTLLRGEAKEDEPQGAFWCTLMAATYWFQK